MILKVFSTKREIREYLKSQKNVFLPKLTTVGEFLEKSIIVKNASMVDNDLRKLYLFKALQKIDAKKLGLKKDFLNFFKNSEFVFSFYNEVFLEKINIEDIETADTYLEYEQHLNILKELYYEYRNLLEKDGLYDRITVQEYQINDAYFENIEKIEIYLSGYLPKFDIEILKKITIPIEIRFNVTPYNKSLISKMFTDLKYGSYVYDFHNSKVLEYKQINMRPNVKTESFSNRINEVNFVFASIEEMVNKGISPEKIAVILPDESFSEYLKVLDIHNNLNFAMGESFIYSEIYILLEAIYRYLTEKDVLSYKKAGEKIEEFINLETFEDILNFILENANMKERKLLDEEIYKISRLKELKTFAKEEILHFILERFKNLKFDDVKGGKVTVMGVLESRGIKYDGVIIVDFNDDVVPNISDKDYFLNSSIRKRTSLPTRKDKESLQKNYYFNILINSKITKIAYVKNEEKDVSRFLYELKLDTGKNMDEYYSEVLYKKNIPEFYEYAETFEVPEILTPTKLKTLMECPARYYFSYVLNIKNDDKTEYFGSRLHNALQKILQYSPPVDENDYFNKIMSFLLKDVSKKEYFEIRSSWEEKIKSFVSIDFKELGNSVQCEVDLPQKKYKNYLLQARADRIIGNKIYDYKTSSNTDYLKDLTQAEFYKYLKPDAEIYYWDIYNVKLIKVDADIKNLEKKIDSLEFYTKRSEDLKKCEFCDYKFACLHLES